MTLRFFWLVLGVASLGAGVAGVVLPILPTTPFILLAAFAFARSSPRLHRWLLAHKRFGPLIENWRKYGAISRRTKIWSLASMAALFALSLVMGAGATVLVVQAIALGGAALFVATRPSPPSEATD
jgi:hypothetical protein